MNDYKVCVYAICKNEEKFVERWYNSMKEADYIVVLDTGSTDNTVKLLSSLPKVIVQQKIIEPWRFDVARNESIKLIPHDTDICVCTDLDEILREGWAAKLKSCWYNGATRGKYTYIWSFDDIGRPAVTFTYEKIHTRNDYEWHHAVHEVLRKITPGEENSVIIPDIILEHHPDPNKSRGDYLRLLKIDVDEKPEDDRARHYYARELMFNGQNEEAIKQFIIHLNLPKATWQPERCASMRYIAKCSSDFKEKEKWLYRAMAEAPYLREPYIDMAFVQYQQKNWYGLIYFCEQALYIKDNPKIYTNDPKAWNETPYDLLSIAYWNINNFKQALFYVNKANELNPYDKRIANNKEIMQKYYNSEDNK